ncbi:MAG: DNA primase [Candidatus Sericytochromatia bacterium]
MSQIDSAIIDEIRSRADIVDVVGQYVSLKRAGARYKGNCPFHSEKTPSFTVNPELQIYKCFGCGAGGNVFTFLMNHQQQSFTEVVRELARQYGVRLVFNETEKQEDQFRVILRRINQEASLFFQWQLKHPQIGETARAYLETRGIEAYYQQRFQIGYAQNSWTALLHHLTEQGFSSEELDKSGLFKTSDKGGGLYDMFRHRVMFPIVSINNDVLGFGGRTLDAELGAKYINSPETELYQKGHHVYGLNLAKQVIRQKDRVILAEGYLDVITAHQYGFSETVAGLGTALTPQQARALLRFSESKRIIMAYDADSAGQKATDRGAEVLDQVAQGVPVRLQVIRIPDQEDPDTFLHRFGAEAFEAVLTEAPSYTAYRIDKLLSSYQLDNPVDKSLAAKACLETLMKLPDPVMRDEYLRYVAERLQIDESALREQIQQQHKRARQTGRKPQPERTPHREGPLPKAAEPLPLRQREFISELGLMLLLMRFPEQREKSLAALQELQFEDPRNEELREYLVSMAEAELELDWQELFLAFPESEMHQRLTEMMENPAFHALEFEKSLADFRRNVKLKCLGLEMQRISAQIQQAEASSDHATRQTMMQRYMELMQDFTRLKQMSL